MPIGAEPASAATARFGAMATAEPGDAVVARLEATGAAVVTDEGERTEAGRDWWPLAMVWARDGEVPARPSVIVRPTTTEQVAAVLHIADETRTPVTPMAGRSGVCGNAVPVFGGIALDLTDLAGIVAVDDESLLLDVRPGTWGDELEDALRNQHGVTLGHWPQ
ncbi:MAG: alkyldihydroxyacetonephosphate synthase, partial [Actinomycetota bacterium]|nr:alkyldihydroxyacetonephosphate synthase [Actinomycetota bacterium]